LRAEVSTLRNANEALSKRRRAKKNTRTAWRPPTVQDAEDLLDQKAINEQVVQETRQNKCHTTRTHKKVRYCGVCGKPRHNTRTCKVAIELSDSATSDVIIVDS
ncbi:hypothetical protein B0O99DRAFT_514621, partial [Bisporella sp. PMI_857]